MQSVELGVQSLRFRTFGFGDMGFRLRGMGMRAEESLRALALILLCFKKKALWARGTGIAKSSRPLLHVQVLAFGVGPKHMLLAF